MNNSSDQQFETYLDGESEISRLYAETKSGSAPEKPSAAIRASARNPGVPSKTKNRFFPWFAMAATIVLAIGIYWSLSAPQQRKAPSLAQAEQSKAIPPSPAQSKPPLESAVKPESHDNGKEYVMGNMDSIIAALPEDTSPRLDSEQQEIALTTGTARAQKPIVTTPPLSVARTPANQSDGKASQEAANGHDNPPALKAPENQAPVTNDIWDSDSDTDGSLDWMNRLAVNQADTRAADKTVASTLAPDKWLADIMRLHRQNKHAAAKKSLLAFRKFYPRYKLPPLLQETYEPR